MKSVYQFREGSHLSGDAQAVGERLEHIRNTRRGLTPEAVLDDARAAGSVLHRYFEWDDRKAAHQYRLDQAGHVIRCVTVTIEEPEAAPAGSGSTAAAVTVRAFVPVVERDSGSRIYESTARALSDTDYRRQVLERAHSELDAVSRKYRDLTELAEVITAIDRVAGLLSAERLPVAG